MCKLISQKDRKWKGLKFFLLVISPLPSPPFPLLLPSEPEAPTCLQVLTLASAGPAPGLLGVLCFA